MSRQDWRDLGWAFGLAGAALTVVLIGAFLRGYLLILG